MAQLTTIQRAVLWGLLLLLLGIRVILAGGGAVLIGAGGSPYYLLAGFAVLVSAWGLYRRRNLAAIAFSALLLATIPWALWEAGFDGWALAPRLIAPAVLGLVFLLPPVHRACGLPNRWWIGGPLLAIVAIFIVSIIRESREYGDLPGAVPVRSAMAANGEWGVWGHDLSGRRYSPLVDINTGNVGKLAVAWTYDSPVEPYGGGGHGFEATPLAIDGKLFVCLDRNVVAALDQETGRANGAPHLPSRARHERWSRVMTDAFLRLRWQVDAGQAEGTLGAYAATDPAEFFAVATEAFFERPGWLCATSPAVFDELRAYYAVDPREWQAH